MDREPAFERAVADAAAIAAQRVARIHRVRLVTQSFLAALAVSCAVALVVGLVFKGEIESSNRTANAQIALASRNNAIGNCQLVKGLTDQMSNFVDTDAALRHGQAQLTSGHVNHVFSHLFGASEFARLEHRSQWLDWWTTHHWTAVIVPHLRQIGGENCQRRVH